MNHLQVAIENERELQPISFANWRSAPSLAPEAIGQYHPASMPLAMAGFAGVALGFGYLFHSVLEQNYPHVLFIALSFVALPCLMGALQERGFKRALRRAGSMVWPAEIQSMLDKPAPQEQYPAVVTILRGERSSRRVIGTDIGVITFSGNLLHFEGRATSFDLPSELACRKGFPFRRRRCFNSVRELISGCRNNGHRLKVDWRDESSDGKLLIVPYVRAMERPSHARDRLRRELLLWSHTLSSVHRRVTLPPTHTRTGD